MFKVVSCASCNMQEFDMWKLQAFIKLQDMHFKCTVLLQLAKQRDNNKFLPEKFSNKTSLFIQSLIWNNSCKL